MRKSRFSILEGDPTLIVSTSRALNMLDFEKTKLTVNSSLEQTSFSKRNETKGNIYSHDYLSQIAIPLPIAEITAIDICKSDGNLIAVKISSGDVCVYDLRAPRISKIPQMFERFEF